MIDPATLKDSRIKMAYAILFGAQLAIGAAAIFARLALHGAGPIAVSALRLTIAALPLFLYSRFVSKKQPVSVRDEFLFSGAGLALAIHFGTWIASLQLTSIAISTLLVSTAPVWIALYDALVLKRKISKVFWLAFTAGAFGTLVIVTGSGAAVSSDGKFALIGDALAALGGLGFAAYLIIIRYLGGAYSTLLVVGRTYSWAAVALIVAAVFARQLPPGNDIQSWFGIIGMAVVSQMLGHTGINASLRSFSATTVAFSTLLEPIFAALLAAVIFAERLSTQSIFGGIVVLVALAVVLREQDNEEQMHLAVESNQL